MRHSPYLFKCFFNKNIKCGQFNPKIWRKKKTLPEPCKRCKYYINSSQRKLESFLPNNSNTGGDKITGYAFDSPRKIEETKKERQNRAD